MLNKHYSADKNRGGQVLLIAVMLLATVVTVVMTIAFNSTSETQVAKLEEDSQKALAAAEAGIDSAIKQNVGQSISIASLGGGDFGAQGITGNAKVVAVAKSTFVSPLLQKDEQYTFYLSDYNTLANPWTGNLSIYFLSEAGSCPSVEVLIVTNTYTQERYAYNTCASVINNATLASNTVHQIDDVSFQRGTDVPIPVTNGLVAMVKVLGGKTKLGFKDEGGAALPSQGKTVESEARTQSGVVKRVQLFQSYPQIPLHFLTTGF